MPDTTPCNVKSGCSNRVRQKDPKSRQKKSLRQRLALLGVPQETQATQPYHIRRGPSSDPMQAQ